MCWRLFRAGWEFLSRRRWRAAWSNTLRFLLLPDGRVLVIFISGGGVTRDKLIRPERPFKQEDLDRTADYLNRHYIGWTLEAMRADLRKQVEQDREQYGRLAGDALFCATRAFWGTLPSARCMWTARHRLLRRRILRIRNNCANCWKRLKKRTALIALLSGCIESPEPVHVELGLDKISNAGKHLAIVSASYSSKDQVQGTLGILAPMRMHYERVITAVAFMAQFFSEETRGELISLASHKHHKDNESSKSGSGGGARGGGFRRESSRRRTSGLSGSDGSAPEAFIARRIAEASC